MGFSLKKLIEGATAQVNPFDNGKTYATVQKQAPAPMPAPQQIQQVQNSPYISEARKQSITSSLNAPKTRFNPFTSTISSLNQGAKDVTKGIADAAVNTVQTPYSAGRLASANITGNKVAADNARKAVYGDANNNFLWNQGFTKTADILAGAWQGNAQSDASKKANENYANTIKNAYIAKGADPRQAQAWADSNIRANTQADQAEQLGRYNLTPTTSLVGTATRVGLPVASTGAQIALNAVGGGAGAKVGTNLVSQATKQTFRQGVNTVGKQALGFGTANAGISVADTLANGGSVADAAKAGVTGLVAGAAMPVAGAVLGAGLKAIPKLPQKPIPAELLQQRNAIVSAISNAEGAGKKVSPVVYRQLQEIDAQIKQATRPRIGGLGQGGYVQNPLAKDSLEALKAEARKYKSADEFVKAFGSPYYHRTNKNFENFDLAHQKTGVAKGVYLMDNLEQASTPIMVKRFGNTIKEVYSTKPIADLTNNTELGKLVGNKNKASQLEDEIKKQGYGGYKYVGETVVHDPSVLKTKQQLTDLYNQATQKKGLFKPLNQGGYIATGSDGKPFVKVTKDQQLFDGKSPSTHPEIARKYLIDNFTGKTVQIDGGGNVKFTNKGAGKYSSSTKGLSPEVLAAKMRLTPELDNAIKISDYRGSKVDTNARHGAFARDGFNYRTFQFEVGGKKFQGTLNLANDGTVQNFYDINPIKKSPGETYSGKNQSSSKSFPSDSKPNIQDNNGFVNRIKGLITPLDQRGSLGKDVSGKPVEKTSNVKSPQELTKAGKVHGQEEYAQYLASKKGTIVKTNDPVMDSFTFASKNERTETLRALETYNNYVRNDLPEGDIFARLEGSYGAIIKNNVSDIISKKKEQLTGGINNDYIKANNSELAGQPRGLGNDVNGNIPTDARRINNPSGFDSGNKGNTKLAKSVPVDPIQELTQPKTFAKNEPKTALAPTKPKPVETLTAPDFKPTNATIPPKGTLTKTGGDMATPNNGEVAPVPPKGKETKFASKTIPESEFVSDKIKGSIKAPEYSVQTEKQGYNSALTRLKSEGDAKFEQSVFDSLDKKNGTISRQEAIDAQTLAAVLDGGDDASIRKATQIYEKLSEHYTAAGQLTQAAAIMARRSPEGLRSYATTALKKSGVTVTPQLEKELTTLVKRLREASPEAKPRAQWEVMNFVAKNIPTSTGDKIINTWRAGLLTAPTTTGGNLLGNSGEMAVRKAFVNPVATAADAVMGAFTGKRTMTLGKAGSGTKGFGEGSKMLPDYLKTGYDPRNNATKYDAPRSINTGSKVLDTYINGVYRMMGVADMPFSIAAEKEALSSIAKAEAINKGLKGKAKSDFISGFMDNPPETALARAQKEADYATFKNPTTLGKAATGLKKPLGPVGDFVVPFTQVPAAIATRIVERTPIGTATEMIKQIKNVKEGGAFDQRAMAQAIGNGAFGPAIMGVGFALADQDMLTYGYPSDAKERKLWDSEGKQPYSVRVGDRWYSLNYLQPFGTLLAIGGQANKAKKEGKDISAIVGQGTATAGQSIMNQSFLKGIGGALDAISDPERSVRKYVEQTTSSTVPNFVRSFARAKDPNQRAPEGIVEGVKSGIPGLRETTTPKLDMFGQALPAKDTFANQYLNPLKPSKVRGDNTTAELRRLQNADLGTMPTEADKAVFGKDKPMTSKQLAELNNATGTAMKTNYDKVIADPAYQALSDEDKVKTLKKINDVVYGAEKIAWAVKNGVMEADPSKLTKEQIAYLQGQGVSFYPKQPTATTTKTSTKKTTTKKASSGSRGVKSGKTYTFSNIASARSSHNSNLKKLLGYSKL